MSKSANAGKKQASTLFKPGQSGNPAGRKRGTRNKSTVAAQVLLDGEAEALTRKAVELALEGNIQALKLCLERLLPPVKERSVSLKLPALTGADDLPKLTAVLLTAVGRGELTIGEAAGLSTLVANHGKALECAELEKRIAALEG
ncbi:DUF5681 domain-containing protein [Desulfovibrio sp. OttesenSCG-928-M16]|nr:DUF5681 domain-containing protein [Desulfovibrio sp. OttesenSCG-928-M16]